MNKMIKRMKSIILATALLLFASPSFAISLHEAKAQNLVGEQSNGYLGTPNAPSADVRYLVQDINAKRRSEYQRIAGSTGSAISQVESLAGEKAINDTQPGRYVKRASQGWSLK